METRPLRTNLMLALVSIIALSLLVDRLYEYAVVRSRDIEQEQMIQVREMCYTLSRDYSRLLLSNRSHELLLSVQAQATREQMRYLAVTDDALTVIAATRLPDRGRSLRETAPNFEPGRFQEGIRGNRILVSLSPDHASVIGYAPVTLPADPAQLRSLRRGLLFVEMDISGLKAASWQHLFSVGNLSRWLLTFLLATLLLAYLLSRQLFVPLRHLMQVSRSLSAGEWDKARSLLTGSSELAKLGNVLNDMAHQIMVERHSLQESEARFRNLVEASPLPMMATSSLPECQVLLVNRRFEALFGYRKEQIPDMDSWWHLACASPECQQEIQTRWQSLVRKIQDQGLALIEPMRVEVCTAAGEKRYVELHMTVQDNRNLVVFNDLTERRHYEEELERLATTDVMTGAYNRSRFSELVHAEVDRSVRYRVSFSLIMFDIDHFKRINDSYGHAVGDSVIVELVRRVQRSLRTTDRLSRWGGEEFVILMPQTDLEGACTMAERCREAVADTPFAGAGQVTISLGVVSHAADEDFDQLFERVDKRLYEAKRAGRNRTACGTTDEVATGADSAAGVR